MAGEKHAYSGQSAAKLQALVIIKASEWTVELEEKLAVVPAWAAEGIVPSVKDALSSGVAGSSVELTFGDRLIYCLDLPVIYSCCLLDCSIFTCCLSQASRSVLRHFLLLAAVCTVRAVLKGSLSTGQSKWSSHTQAGRPPRRSAGELDRRV